MRYIKTYFSYTSCFIALQIALLFFAVHREQHFMRAFYTLQKAEMLQAKLQQNLLAAQNQLQALTTAEAVQQRATNTLKLQKLPLSAIRSLYDASHD